MYTVKTHMRDYNCVSKINKTWKQMAATTIFTACDDTIPL